MAAAPGHRAGALPEMQEFLLEQAAGNEGEA